MNNDIKLESEISTTGKLKFFIISFIGIIAFFISFKIGDLEGVGISIISDFTKSLLKPYRPNIIIGILMISLVASIIAKVFKPKFIMDRTYLRKNFCINSGEILIRLAAVAIAFMVTNNIGPDFIKGETTGQEMFGLSFSVIILLFFAAYLLPSLLDFGMMDFIGVIASKIMRPLFTLPGRAALDTIASWVGSGSVGVMITSQEYEKGGYTKREASVIATTFSVTSVSYAVFMADYVGLSHLFPQFYGTCILCGLVCAFIMPRIQPLSKVEDTYYNGLQTAFDESIPSSMNIFKWAYIKGLQKAEASENLTYYAKKGTSDLIGFWFSLIPIVIAVGTGGLILVNYTPIFQYIAYPFQLILQLFQVPEAAKAAPAMIVGFIDFFIPLPIANQIQLPITSFVITCMALIQIIYLTQTGALMMRSKMDLTLKKLFVIFLERTIISLPIICGVAHILF